MFIFDKKNPSDYFFWCGKKRKNSSFYKNEPKIKLLKNNLMREEEEKEFPQAASNNNWKICEFCLCFQNNFSPNYFFVLFRRKISIFSNYYVAILLLFFLSVTTRQAFYV